MARPIAPKTKIKKAVVNQDIEAFIWICMEMFIKEQFDGQTFGKNNQEMFRFADVKQFVRDLIELKKMNGKADGNADADQSIKDLQAWMKKKKVSKGKSL